MIIFVRIVFGIGLLLALNSLVVQTSVIWRAFRRGAWIVKKRGVRDLVRRSEQPRRFWLWTAVAIAVFAVGAAPVPILAWAIAHVRNSS